MTKLFTKVQAAVADRQQDEEGAAMVEYGLLVALIAVVVAVGAGLLGVRIDALFDSITF
jgi:pilus assembly protein Flp/PilA